MGERTSYPPGTFSWVDLQTTDQDAAKSFYADLLGWQYDEIPIGDGATYAMAKLQGHSVAAIGGCPPSAENPCTIVSNAVPS